MRKELARYPKRQHLKTLQRALVYTAWRLSARMSIFATPGLLKLTLVLGFHLDHRDNLCIGLRHFGIGQHTSATWNVLKARLDQHQVIAGGGATPSLAHADMLTTPDSVSLTDTLTMARGPTCN